MSLKLHLVSFSFLSLLSLFIFFHLFSIKRGRAPPRSAPDFSCHSLSPCESASLVREALTINLLSKYHCSITWLCARIIESTRVHCHVCHFVESGSIAARPRWFELGNFKRSPSWQLSLNHSRYRSIYVIYRSKKALTHGCS